MKIENGCADLPLIFLVVSELNVWYNINNPKFQISEKMLQKSRGILRMDELQKLQESNELLTKSIVDIVGEMFRFKRVFLRAISKLEEEDQSKYASQFTWFTKRVDKAAENAGLRILDLSGQIYDPGMAVTALNIEDFDKDDELYIEQMMEPVIMKDDKIQKTGTVILGRMES